MTPCACWSAAHKVLPPVKVVLVQRSAKVHEGLVQQVAHRGHALFHKNLSLALQHHDLCRCQS